jgi:membrane associated rhomboid family serine protease
LKAVPDRYSFSSGFGRGRFSSGGGQPWFVVGTLEFTTTVTLIAANIVWMFVYAAEGREHSLTRRLWLTTEDLLGPGVLGGEVWRLVTWPLVAEPSLWTVIGLAFFYIFGGQMEALMGRRHFFSFILALTLVPAIMVTIFDALVPSFAGLAGGIDMVQFGVIIAFVAQYPTAKFFFGIPAPIMIGVFVALQYLSILADRDEFRLVLVTAAIATALIAFKSLGYANSVPWIPSVPLPASATGASTAPTRPAAKQRRPRRRGRGNLKAVPTRPTSPPQYPLADMEIDSLLDQVAEQGLDSLTKDQRKRLEEHSKRLRKRRDQ